MSYKLRKELATAQQNAETERRSREVAQRNAEVAQQTLQNLEHLGISHELIERARNMR